MDDSAVPLIMMELLWLIRYRVLTIRALTSASSLIVFEHDMAGMAVRQALDAEDTSTILQGSFILMQCVALKGFRLFFVKAPDQRPHTFGERQRMLPIKDR